MGGDRTATGTTWTARVETIVARIPPGRVMTYGMLATAAGRPGAARHAGLVAACATSPGLPWHRVVRAGGALAWTTAEGDAWQRDALAAEGVTFTPSGRIAGFDRRAWWPDGGPHLD
ncbi:MAG: MGMT family protein [Actinomycetia bacterium]|nr:MGMT family protein [Actinomycetes bacterium]